MTMLQFEYVLAVIDHGSFSRAAEACFVTQPTLSAQIAKLEHELGLVLLDRVSKPVGPAPGAREILQRARAALQLFRSIPSLASEACSAFTGEFRLGIIPTLGQYLVPRFLEGFMAKFPDLALSVSELQSDDILAGLRDFRLDCGILALPTGTEALVEQSLFLEEFMAYLPPGQEGTERIDVHSLKREGLLLLTEGHCLRDQIIDLCGSGGQEQEPARIAFETGSLESLKRLVDQGLGYTLLTELSVLDMGPEKLSQVRSLGPVPPLRNIGLVSHPAYARPKLLGFFAQAIRASLPPEIRNRKSPGFVPWRGPKEGSAKTRQDESEGT